MKYNKAFIIRSMVLSALISVGASCSNFLDEELTTQRNNDYFKTAEGLKSLATGFYYNFRFHFAYEWSFAHTNYGTDEFKVGGDASNGMWNNYDGNLASAIPAVNVNTVMANDLWDNMYVGINSANLFLQNAKTILPEGAEKDVLTGEAYFLRAFNYQKLVRQFGGVPLKLEPSITPEREFVRASAAEVTAQIIDDFTSAYDLLPATSSVVGKLTKDAAAHFLAKAYLFRASEINDEWNGSTKTNDLQSALELAQEVIGHRQLAPNFAELWNYTTPDGANEKLNEIIFAAQFTFDRSTRGTYGNQTHLYYLAQYSNLPHFIRDIAGGREYQRLRTNYYVYKVYDLENDSRFWKSFRTKYKINNPVATSSYVKGDLGILYIVNQPDDTRFTAAGSLATVTDPETGKIIPHVFAAYAEGSEYLNSDARQNRFPSLSKFTDGSREAVGDGIGYRDGILARLADTYLTAAEICIRQGNYSLALDYINDIRARAGYKDGEDRTAHSDGGAATAGVTSYSNKSSYYESNNIPVSTAATNLEVTSFATLPAEDEAIIADLGYTSEYDRAMCFLLNERSRELMGEFYRWEDLSRTKTLINRTQRYNSQAAANINEKHYYRAIPQTHLDGIQKNGRALTPDEKQAEQNEGY
jgi:hypothetical protein